MSRPKDLLRRLGIFRRVPLQAMAQAFIDAGARPPTAAPADRHAPPIRIDGYGTPRLHLTRWAMPGDLPPTPAPRSGYTGPPDTRGSYGYAFIGNGPVALLFEYPEDPKTRKRKQITEEDARAIYLYGGNSVGVRKRIFRTVEDARREADKYGERFTGG